MVIHKEDGPHKQRYTAPACINIEAGTHHSIIAIRDAVWFCIHAINEKDLNKVDEVLVQQ